MDTAAIGHAENRELLAGHGVLVAPEFATVDGERRQLDVDAVQHEVALGTVTAGEIELGVDHRLAVADVECKGRLLQFEWVGPVVGSTDRLGRVGRVGRVGHGFLR